MRIYYIILLLLVFLFAVFIKTNIYENSRKGAFIPLTNVNAFHYYFAKEIAEGRKIKVRETKIQYPEGIEVFRKTSIFMEYIAGYLYRWGNKCFNMSFDNFARNFVRIVSSLTIFAVYLVTYEIYKSRLAGLVSSLFYSVSLPAIIRSVGFGFLRENFTLPIIFFQFLFFMLAIKGTRWLFMALVSGMLMFVALASWHFSQFYLVLIEGFVFICLLFNKDSHNRLMKVFSTLLAFGFASGIFVPYLAANRFIISYPMLIGYAIVGGHFLSLFAFHRSLVCPSEANFAQFLRSLVLRLRTCRMQHIYAVSLRHPEDILKRKLHSGPCPLTQKMPLQGKYAYFLKFKLGYIGMFLITFLVLIILAHPYQKDAEVYSHVYSMGIYQLKYLGKIPVDSSKVPFDAKLLWEESHGAPRLRDALYDFTVPLLVALVPIFFMIKKIIREGWDEKNGLLIYFLITAFILYLFINRLMVFLAFFLSIFAGGLILCKTGFQPVGRTGVPPVKKQWIKVVSISFVIVAILAETVKASVGGIDVREGIYISEILGWIDRNTAKEDVILAPPRSSPEILAYTDRPVVLHAKLESKEIRSKTRRWAESLFVRDEEILYGLCKEWGVKYLVHPIGTYSATGPASWGYITNNIDKDKEAVGYKLEALPEHTSEFGFLFKGRSFTGTASAGFKKPDLKHFELVFQNRVFNIYKVR